MQTQKHLKSSCIDGRCPERIDSVKEITLSPLEKRAIFFVLEGEIKRARKRADEAEKEALDPAEKAL